MKRLPSIEQTIRCPVCGSEVELGSLGRTGLSPDELCQLGSHVKNGTIRDVLNIAEIALRRLDPEKTSVEFQVSESVSKMKTVSDQMTERFMQQQKQFIEELSHTEGKEKMEMIREYEEKQTELLTNFQKELVEKTKTVENLEKERVKEFTELNQAMKEIREKITGTGIGDVGEIISVVDLKKTTPNDSFSEIKAAKHGTDILATVKEKGKVCGKITISVKYQQTWHSDFLEQLTKNMTEDGTRCGMLVSRKFPREALSNKAWVTEDESGNTVILVKPEYAPIAYAGLRQAVVYWCEVKQTLKRRESETAESEKIAKVLSAWINGEEFEESVRHIDNARKEAERTTSHLHQLQNHVNVKVQEAIKFQDLIVAHLVNAKNLVGRLRELLDGTPSSTETEESHI